jgi:ribonuclease Z
LLGTGTPVVDPARSGPATAIIVDDYAYIVDAGPGIVRRAELAAETLQLPGLLPAALDKLFITHLHSDHTLGLPDLMLSPWVIGRDTALEVYGPPGIEAMAEHLLSAYAEDIRLRIDGLEDRTPIGYQVNAHEIEPGVVYEDSRVTVEAIAINHGSWTSAFGYRFTTPDRVIVISGDTAPSDNLVEAAKDADMLIHEVYTDAYFDEESAYHSAFHTSTLELGEIARRAKPGLLVLYHQLFFGATSSEMLAEIADVYTGPVISGRDLDTF